MRNFQDTFEIRKRSFIGTFSICMTVPLMLRKAFWKFYTADELQLFQATLVLLRLIFVKWI